MLSKTWPVRQGSRVPALNACGKMAGGNGLELPTLSCAIRTQSFARTLGAVFARASASSDQSNVRRGLTYVGSDMGASISQPSFLS